MKLNSLQKAKNNKNDEFYTRYEDIEKEVQCYVPHFRNKVVLCNCDNPTKSHFFRYFVSNFDVLHLKKLLATFYTEEGSSYFVEVGQQLDLRQDEVIDLSKLKVIPLKGNGDFLNEENIQLLKSSDIVVTNPPFSLFREYVGQLIEHQKQFLIIGSFNAVCYKDVFPLIQQGRIWLGKSMNGAFLFGVPEDYSSSQIVMINGKRMAKFGNCCWFTNMDYPQRHQELTLTKSFQKDDYPEYENYHAIEVSKVKNIPKDYLGVMGVPITFLMHYNPEQFEIIGQTHSGDRSPAVQALRKPHRRSHHGIVNGKELYARILIKRKSDIR